MTRSIARTLVFFLSLALTVAEAVLAAGFVGVWAALSLTRHDIVVSATRMAFWPRWCPTVSFYFWGAPLYLAGAILTLFMLLPLTLAVLERLSLAFAGHDPDKIEATDYAGT